VLADRDVVLELVPDDELGEFNLQESKNTGGLAHGRGRGAILRGVVAPTVRAVAEGSLQRVTRLTLK
jgi:hypothetical protein